MMDDHVKSVASVEVDNGELMVRVKLVEFPIAALRSFLVLSGFEGCDISEMKIEMSVKYAYDNGKHSEVGVKRMLQVGSELASALVEREVLR